MNLTRTWQTNHNGKVVEVQWTGMQFREGWMLRLLVNGNEVAKTRTLSGEVSLSAGSGVDAVKVDFRQLLFRNQCTISVDGLTLLDQTQPWNALAMTVVLAPFVVLIYRVIGA